MNTKTITGTDVFLRSLKELGADYLFTTPGPEFTCIAEAYERGPSHEYPKPMIVPHEALAVSMAQGYFLACGRPGVVLTSLNVGTANSLAQLIGAKAMNIPLLFISGRSPALESAGLGARDRAAHWVHESFAPSGMLAEYMKWNYDLQHVDQLQGALTRAWQIMTSSPGGPVSLSLSREILLAACAGGELISSNVSPNVSPKAVAPPVPSAQAVDAVRVALHESSRPLVITSRSGLNARTVPLLEEFADRYQTGVLCPMAQAVNIRSDQRCFLGFCDERVLKEADLLLVLDTDVPWIPSRYKPTVGARVIQIGPDPLFENIPLRSFESHLNIQAGVEEALRALIAVAPRTTERSLSAWVTANLRVLPDASKKQNANATLSSELPTVHYPHPMAPVFIRAFPDKVFVDAGDTVQLGCRLWGLPNSFVNWTQDAPSSSLKTTLA